MFLFLIVRVIFCLFTAHSRREEFALSYAAGLSNRVVSTNVNVITLSRLAQTSYIGNQLLHAEDFEISNDNPS